jgi:GNAT superfamily N-acetyltransferase
VIRAARPEDAEAVVRIFRESRAEAMPWLPIVHSAAEDLDYFRSTLAGQAFVFEFEGRIAGFAVLGGAVLDALYVAPEAQAQGVGAALFDWAVQLRPHGFRLWVFRDNAHARRFYEARGCRVLRETDGAGNEERTPDVLYECAPAGSTPANPSTGPRPRS